MKKIFISAGHSNQPNKDCGAVGNGFVEGVLAAELRTLIAAKLQNIYGIIPVMDDDSNVLLDTIRKFRNMTAPDSIVIDIHFNASANAEATGTEVLIPGAPSDTEKKLASYIAFVTAEIIGIKNRGVKSELESHHGRLGWMRLTGENILIEVCFITNAKDMKHYNDYKNTLAAKYAEVISGFARA